MEDRGVPKAKIVGVQCYTLLNAVFFPRNIFGQNNFTQIWKRGNQK